MTEGKERERERGGERKIGNEKEETPRWERGGCENREEDGERGWHESG